MGDIGQHCRIYRVKCNEEPSFPHTHSLYYYNYLLIKMKGMTVQDCLVIGFLSLEIM